MVKAYDELPWILRLILTVVPAIGWVVAGVYRILLFVENKNTKTLIFGILSFVPLTAPIFWIADVVATITKGKFAYLLG